MESLNLGFRFFVVGDDNSISRISQRSYTDFYMKRKPSLQRFAGSTINVATVIYTLENRKPKQIVRIDHVRVRVDSEGAPDQAQKDENLRLIANHVGKLLGDEEPVETAGNVVSAVRQFDERHWAQLHPQLPGPALKRILEILFGGQQAV
ncbi:hypothetical protein [Accumulibacter sp.]|uniref:hypothetical protein n=1 Tax=Accumulibacter sp. TaxID=2053492 RepID=UPI001ACA9764|nr:hypothetical protein [Accumulibacter sp.]MBN8455857.1 hypothetical protein [Accumulibacter sp.]MBO3705912.1 hypothetical protein [Candidatus Accumulibacter conexus]